jgi:hypothetical protein
MNFSPQQRTRQYIHARQQHPAWRLLASPRAPLVLGCLTTLFEHAQNGIAEEDALQALSEMLAAYAGQDEFAIDPDNTRQQAGRELREWIKRGLVIERGQRLYATDALATAIQFVDSLDNRIMTSTASRLSVVQSQIEKLETGLNPNPASRIASLQGRIAQLQQELAAAEAGDIPVLSSVEAIEGIREIFSLATGLSADFRRVEDSWREADRLLRQSIMAEGTHRGVVVDRLLDGQAALLNTPEGRVFDGFIQQLRQTIELENMNHRIRTILAHPAAPKALNRNQLTDLKWLRLRLAQESKLVLQARARSEQDVRGFLKSGLAAEHHKVGQILTEIMKAALDVDWQRQKVRRAESPLPPLGFALANVPLVERLRFKNLENPAEQTLDFTAAEANLGDLDEEFWAALDGLDRDVVIAETLAVLAAAGRPLSLVELAEQLPPTHDLETFALWIGMAREAGIDITGNHTESLELTDAEHRRWAFSLPLLSLDAAAFAGMDWEF